MADASKPPDGALKALVRLAPLHDLPTRERGRLGILRRRGRPRSIAAVPTADEAAYAETVSKLRADHVETDTLVRALEGSARAVDVLRAIEEGLAIENASLRWELEHGHHKGRVREQMMSRRIDGLSKLAAVELAIHRLGATEGDLRSARYQRVFTEFLGVVEDVLIAVLAEPEPLLAKLRVALAGWEDRVFERG